MAEEPNVRLSDRLVAAAGASVVAALIVNPLDVVKTRIQAQAAACSVNSVQSRTSLYESHRRWLDPAVSRWTVKLPKLTAADNVAMNINMGSMLSRRWAVASCPACECDPSVVTGPKLQHVRPTMWSTFRSIIQKEGPAVMWRGSTTSLMISVPMVGIYMPLYDAMMAEWSQPMGAYAPMAAGSISRALAVFCVAPLELIRTRLYATRRGTTPALRVPASTTPASAAAARSSATAVLEALRTAPQMWRGLNATLARDVPFSALYWSMLEPIRQSMLCGRDPSTFSSDASDANKHRQQLLLANLTAGAVAGGSAAGLTTPFDVIKTRHQIMDPSKHEGVFETWGLVWRREGIRGLFRGVGPRSARAAPACAIVIAVYELVKDAMSSSRDAGSSS